MNILIFPFYIERFDDMQGVYGRQIPHLLAAQLQEAGFNASSLTWFARRGETLAHVCAEASFPENVLSEEQRAHGAEAVLLGRVRVAPEDTHLQIAQWFASEDADEASTRILFDEHAAMHALPRLVQRAADAVQAHFASDTAPSVVSTPHQDDDETISDAEIFAGWRDMLLDRDARALESANLG